MAQLNPQNLAQAIQVGASIYELILSNWGNRGIKQDPNNGSVVYPPTPSESNGALGLASQAVLPYIPSLAAIAISPRSDLDRCILTYAEDPQAASTVSQQPPTTAIANGFFNQGGILETQQILSIHAPLIGPQPGPLIIRAHPAGWYGDTYTVSGGGTGSFGTALTYTGNSPTWLNPELRLLLYLTSGLPLPPGRRAPYHYENVFTFPGLAQQLIAVVPVLGRKNVYVSVQAGTGTSVDVQLSGTFHTLQPYTGTTPFVTGQDNEVILVEATTVDTSTGANLTFAAPNVAFMLLKATTSQGGQTLAFSIDAFD